MADRLHKRSPTPPRQLSSEDPATAAARKELKQTVLSDKPDLSSSSSSSIVSASATKPKDSTTSNTTDSADAASRPDKTPSEATTPDRDLSDSQSNRMKDQISSPKKKRAHDGGDVSPIGAISRTERSEPEKKRARDVSSEIKMAADDSDKSTGSQGTSKSQPKSAESQTDKAVEATKTATSEKGKNTTTTTTSTTSASAFGSSGLAGFASQASPFLQAGTKNLSSFASASGSQSPFGAAQPSKPAIFGSNNLSNGASPFGQVGGASKPFGGSSFGGSAFGGGFGNTIGGKKLTSFGNSGQSFKSSKPARPFGAPENDEENGEEGNEDGGSEDDAKDASEERDVEENSAPADDKKKTKLQRVEVEDGEAGEATLIQVRTKLYNLDKATNSWKERGGGVLKINVPLSCVDIDEDTGLPIPGTFDASALDDTETKVVRLIMRQDATHKVILNTVVIPAMSFQYKENSSNVAHMLFTGIEGNGEAVPMQLKMKSENAKNFLNEVEKVQRELQMV